MVPVRSHANAFDELQCPLAAFVSGWDVHECQLHILKHCKAVNNVVVLENKRYVFFAVRLPVRLHIVRGRLPVDVQLPLLIGVDPADCIEQSRFTAPGLTGHGDEFTRIKRQIYSSDPDSDSAFGYINLAEVFEC